jgi:hypothetical protein
MKRKCFVAASLSTFVLAQFSITGAFAQATKGKVAITTQEASGKDARMSAADFKNAKPMENLVKFAPKGGAAAKLPAEFGTPGFAKGSAPTAKVVK